MLTLTFVLHPWTDPEGWRWACYLSTPDEAAASPLSNCVNAGWEPTRLDADLLGQTVLYSLMVLLMRLHIPHRVEPVDWATDPFPALAP
jgi:hypothetical protein